MVPPRMSETFDVIYSADPARGATWRRIFQDELPQATFRVWPEAGTPESVEYVIAWMPPPGIGTAFPNLKVLFSTGAGIDQLDLDSIPDSIQVVRMIDPNLTSGMVEFATMGVLALHRDIPHYLADQRAGLWAPRPIRRAADRIVGIMGLGVLGRAVADALKPFNFTLKGWSASPKSIDGMQTFAGAEELPAFLSDCDILVCLLPLTSETEGLLCDATFKLLPRGARLLNLGRGRHLVEEDLLLALESGRIDCAMLDVLRAEPPEAGHPLFGHPRVVVTPHIASTTHPVTAAQRVCALIKQHRQGLPLEDAIDRRRGY